MVHKETKAVLLPKRKKALLTFFLLWVIALIALTLSYNYFIEFSAFFVGIAKYVIAITLFWLIDTFAVSEVNTMELIGKDPVAYAIFLLSNAILIAGCISTS